MEQGKFQEADEVKLRLEEEQRGKTYMPKYFRLRKDGEYELIEN